MAPYLPPKRLRVYHEYTAASPDHFSSYQEDIRHYSREFLRIAREEGLDPDPEALYQWLDTMSANQLSGLYDYIQRMGAESVIPAEILQ